MQFETLNNNFDTVLAVYTGSAVNLLTLVTMNDDGGDNNASLLTFTATAGVSYAIVVVGYNTGEGTFSIKHISGNGHPDKDNFSGRRLLQGTNDEAGASNVLATRQIAEPLHSGLNSTKSLWYTWTAPEDGFLSLYTVSSLDTLLGVYSGSFLSSLNPVASNDNLSGSDTNSRVGLYVTEGQQLQIAVDSKPETPPGTFSLRLELVDCVNDIGCLVTKLYYHIDQRFPAGPDHTFWRDNICSKQTTPGNLIKSLFDAGGFVERKEFIARCYMGIYNNNSTTTFGADTYRIPDLSGWKNWNTQITNLVAGGSTVKQAQLAVINAFISSPEWTTRIGNPTNSQFVDFLYVNILGRAPDSGGKTFHLNRLNGGQTTKRELVWTFIRSPEAVSKYKLATYVCNAHLCLLDRKPTLEEIASANEDFIADNVPPVEYFTNIVNGPYHNRLSSESCFPPYFVPENAAPVLNELPATESVAYNLVTVDKSGTVGALSAWLTGNGGSVRFEIYEYDQQGEPSLIAASDRQELAGGDGEIVSPELGVSLSPGKLYSVGIKWTGQCAPRKSSGKLNLSGASLHGSISGESTDVHSAQVDPSVEFDFGLRFK